MNSTIESERSAVPAEASKPKAKRATNKSKPAKKAAKAKKAFGKTAAEPSNKRAEVITMLKRAKGATLAEIMKATSWQAHTVRGFISILGSKGGEKVESSKTEAGERVYRIAK